MVQMDFLAANHVRIVGLCKSVKNAKAHRADMFAIAQVSCIIVRQEDKAKVRNVKVTPNEECVQIPKHKLLVMDMWFNTKASNTSIQNTRIPP